MEQERRNLYIIGWILLALAGVLMGISRGLNVQWNRLTLPCIFHSITGLYCPGCGGTRAVRFLIQGEILKSIYYHPFVLYGAVLYVWFMLSNSMEYLSHGRIRIGMRYHKWYVVAGVVILIINFIIKNGVLLIWHYPMIG
ncbi:MAG: DUF2752 domain-containing protein [Blautia sp.]|nr:DUF2752 domain-containing protein [Blautia sp.]MDY4516379.1 DUF2752 domain-containing protein [Lachnospiraceae bacterium]